jgi:hypothetical protein
VKELFESVGMVLWTAMKLVVVIQIGYFAITFLKHHDVAQATVYMALLILIVNPEWRKHERRNHS